VAAELGFPEASGLGSVADLVSVRARVCELRDAIANDASARLRAWSANDTEPSGMHTWSDAANLACYLALRARDVRRLQVDLAELGLSSLGRCEAHVLPTLDAIAEMLDQATGAIAESDGDGDLSERRTSISQASTVAASTLQRSLNALFGAPMVGRHPRIMVTLASEAADDPDYVSRLVAAGMDCGRINCGHDTPDQWIRMARNVRAAAAATGRSCSVLMDLSGPRLRTGPIGPGPEVVRVRPRRNDHGDVIESGVVVLDGSGALGAPPAERDAPGRVAVDPRWLVRLQPGDSVDFTDLPGRSRSLLVVAAPTALERRCEATSGCFIGRETELRHRPVGGAAVSTTAVVGPIDAPPAEIRVHVGDRLTLTRDGRPGRPAVHRDDLVVEPARIPIGAPEVIDHLRPGQRVLIDGGAIGTVVDCVDETGAHLIVDSARPKGSRIRAEKGLNFPDSAFPLPSLTVEDLEALDVVVEHADAVGHSFVRSAADIDALVNELGRRGGDHLAVLAKIETADGVANLPEIIVRGSRRHPFGVMIARGDLAIEIGYQRLAEVQEEILWICEAAHVPVVWATEVLERMVHTGVPSRAEITDAVAAERAECVMLNKGPYLLEGVEVLHNLLRQTAPRHHKKTDLLTPLDLSK